MEEVCYTREGALENAIQMEAQSFEVYKNAYMTAKDKRAKSLLKEMALDELEHRYILEKAFFEETVALHDAGEKEGPSMKFSLLFEEKPLSESATEQDVYLFAIHEEKRAVDFYKNMAGQCGDAPMGNMYSKLQKDEEGHLSRLEELYESIYLKEM
jgi:rubrerythrin